MTSLCPLCQSPLVLFSRREVECKGWNCQFSIPLDDATIIAAALAHHMRPLAEPHPFKDNPGYPDQCDEPVGVPIMDDDGDIEWQTVPCNRPKECH